MQRHLRDPHAAPTGNVIAAARQVPHQNVQRGIPLGTTHKSLTVENTDSWEPAASLRYFEQCSPEVQEGDCPEDHRRRLEAHLLKF